MTHIIERVEAHYEVQAVEMGTLYRWCPESVVIECDCEQRFTTEVAMVASCPRCGADHTGVARELGARSHWRRRRLTAPCVGSTKRG